MNRLKLILSIIFLIALIVLIVIPIGSSTENNTSVIGFRLDNIIHSLIYLPWLPVMDANIPLMRHIYTKRMEQLHIVH